MAQIWLTHTQLQADLPQVCMRCGAPATQVQERTLRWSPLQRWQTPFLLFLIVASVVLSLLAVLPPAFGWWFFYAPAFLFFEAAELLTTRRVRLRVPYCDADAAYWSWGNLVYYPSLAALVIVAVLAAAATPLGFAQPPVAVMVGVLGSLAVLVGIGLVLREHAVTRAEIRPLQIGKDAVLLAGVAPRFVEAAQ